MRIPGTKVLCVQHPLVAGVADVKRHELLARSPIVMPDLHRRLVPKRPSCREPAIAEVVVFGAGKPLVEAPELQHTAACEGHVVRVENVEATLIAVDTGVGVDDRRWHRARVSDWIHRTRGDGVPIRCEAITGCVDPRVGDGAVVVDPEKQLVPSCLEANVASGSEPARIALDAPRTSGLEPLHRPRHLYIPTLIHDENLVRLRLALPKRRKQAPKQRRPTDRGDDHRHGRRAHRASSAVLSLPKRCRPARISAWAIRRGRRRSRCSLASVNASS